MRPKYIWAIFALCLAIGLLTMAWLTGLVVQLDESERQVQQRMQLEEQVRLALWHLDSVLVPLIAQENAHPHFFYRPFYPVERAYTKMYARIKRGRVLMPSPLLTQVSPHVLLHFELAPDHSLKSPQVPKNTMRDRAEMEYTTPQKIAVAEQRLQQLTAHLDRDELLRCLPREKKPPNAKLLRRDDQPQQQADKYDWQARHSNVQQATAQSKISYTRSFGLPENVAEGIMKPVWATEEILLLARRVAIDGQTYIQGCWLDWKSIRSWLLEQVEGQKAIADLRPALHDGEEKTRRLTTLPLYVVPKVSQVGTSNASSTIHLSLLVAWGCMLFAVFAIAALLSGVVSLSERRGAFVSAVTHELRTPLTTFRLYTEMLSEGMVRREKRQRYLDTLRREAERLGHLVENVLAYARLESRRTKSHCQELSAEKLLGEMQQRLARRAGEAEMELHIDFGNRRQTKLYTDVSAVEQILFNLIDNACKYAADTTRREITVTTTTTGNKLCLAVRDYGPGIARHEARKLFLPFRKSAKDAAGSAPGVGLGLALSRRLARQLKGKLYLDRTVSPGACFCLELPLSRFS